MNSKGKKRNIASVSPVKRQRLWSTLSSSSATGESDPDDPPPVPAFQHYTNNAAPVQYGAESDDTDERRPSTGQESEDEETDDVSTPAMYSAPKEDATNPASRMMAKMGYKKGSGLGKMGQGIKEPVRASTQKGKRGFGLVLREVEGAAAEFDSSMEVISVKEQVEWLEGAEDPPPPYDELLPGIIINDKKLTLNDEVEFCDPKVLSHVIDTKTVLDHLEGKEKLQGRSKANPFESIKGVFFLNRAAMKMANMDAVFDFMFTEPRNANGEKLLGPYDLLYFADVCAGPGGFSEYVLWRKGWRAKGIGFTLKEQNDFKLDEFFAAPNDTFEPYYGVNEDGDVYKPDNIESLYKHVMYTTDGIGVHFMMADGGFDVAGQENIQEILSKRLYLCQCLVALRIVRIGGHFVVKLFDVFTPFSAGIIYLMHRCFSAISIHKPNTSRPANSERYLICKGKREGIEGVIQYMNAINKKLAELENTKKDISDIYPIEILTNPGSPFFEYLYASNNRLGHIQYVQLLKFISFCNDSTKVEVRQGNLRAECLELWKIPDKPRQNKPLREPYETATALIGATYTQDFKDIKSLKGSIKEITARLKNVSDCTCCVIAGKEDEPNYGTQPALFLGVGGPQIYRWERGKWIKKQGQCDYRLTRDTVILGEIVKKFKGGGGNQTFVETFYIIDGAVLGGENISDKPLSERLKLCETFARAMNRRNSEVRAKEMLPLGQLSQILKNVDKKQHKNGRPCLAYKLDHEWFLKATGVLCLPHSTPSWIRSFSTTRGCHYYYNIMTRNSITLEDNRAKKEAIANFKSTYSNMSAWLWEGVQFFEDQQRDESAIQFEVMINFIGRK